jgi:MFS family permease
LGRNLEAVRAIVDEKDFATTRHSDRTRRPSSSSRGLDWLVFFVADIQTGFGPFVAVYLTTQKWNQIDIGLLLTTSSLVALFGQIPAGAVVDAAKSIRAVVAFSLIGICVSAFAFAAWPIFGPALATRVLHAMASCVLGLALVSLSLGLAGDDAMGERLGRNAAFAAAGTGIAAGVMGFCGYYLSPPAVFYLAGALTLPALFALSRIVSDDIGPASDASYGKPADLRALMSGVGALARNGAFLRLALCLALFQLANAGMLPLAASMVTLRSSQAATIMVAASIVVPQFVMTVLSQWVGRKARIWGRRPLLLMGFGALALRGLAFSLTGEPALLVAFQALDGVSAATLAVVTPLVIVDITREGGHFNLALGLAGSAVGVGAALSTTLTGYLSDHYGSYAAFNMLTLLSAAGFAAVKLLMPETRPGPAGYARRIKPTSGARAGGPPR